VRHDTGGECEPLLLSSRVNRAEQTTSGQAASTRFPVHGHLPHLKEVDYQSAFTGAEAGKAVSAAAHGSENTSGGSGAHGSLHISKVCAASDQAGFAGYHTVPNASGEVVSVLVRAQQVSAELAFQ